LKNSQNFLANLHNWLKTLLLKDYKSKAKNINCGSEYRFEVTKNKEQMLETVSKGNLLRGLKIG
jgi:hypothetical protein